jgi:hypothetical protein
MKKDLILVCDSQCYHAMDWFHIVKDISKDKQIAIATDIVGRSGAFSLIRSDDSVFVLFDVNPFLFKGKSKISDIWRNGIKSIATPFQISRLKELEKKNPDAIFHAHSMYYIFLCWLSGVKFVATPMGSDVLVRPEESRIYKYLTRRSLEAAEVITVDSNKLYDKVKEISGSESKVIQNGINVTEISLFENKARERNKIVSIRGFYPNYQIEKILSSRNVMSDPPGIKFIYPFYEENYRVKLKRAFIDIDIDLGRLGKEDLYKILSESYIVVSIPKSDSSPRSVYEAIFSGCAVAVTFQPWIDTLPSCMAARVIIVNLDNPEWFRKALIIGKKIASQRYIPTREALKLYDQVEAMKVVCREVYNFNI